MTNQSFELVQIVANQASRAPEKRPRRYRSAQTPRNLAIFKQVEIEQLTHDEVAQKHDIDRSRVSQIVKKVRMELAQASAADPEIKDHLARTRLDQHLERLRLEYALEAAAKAMRRDPRWLTTTRTGTRQKGDAKEGWSETVQRDVAPNVQTIKTYLRVNQDLGKLRDRQSDSAPPPEKPSYDEILEAIQKTLEYLCYADVDDDLPSDRFCRMLANFRANIFSWLLRRRDGASRADAWPDEPLPAQIHQRLRQLNRERRLDASYVSDKGISTHQASPEINTELTTSSAADADTTSDQSNSCADPADRDAPIVLPM